MKSITRDDILNKINSLHLTATMMNSSSDFARGHSLALLALAESCGIRDEFLEYAGKLRQNTIELLAGGSEPGGE